MEVLGDRGLVVTYICVANSWLINQWNLNFRLGLIRCHIAELWCRTRVLILVTVPGLRGRVSLASVPVYRVGFGYQR